MTGIEIIDQFIFYILLCLFGTGWVVMKAVDIYQRIKVSRYKMLLTIIESAVQETYDTYTREIKKAREDGKLTPEERRKAFDLALQKAVEIGKRQRLEIMKLLPKEVLKYYILRALQRLKMRRAMVQK
ncbi:MAG: hypothetical protein N3G21_12625 [Candidatus Hydrogenedentes bacterium]|nr:hypothetical protein [Candidatus Hydrogenedentota bacterium]